MTRPIVVLDANVLASSAFATVGPLLKLKLIWQAEQILVIASDHVWKELLTTLNKRYWRQRIDFEALQEALRLIEERVVLVKITVEILGVASHEEDDLVIATAVSGDADYLVTGDKELRAVGEHLGVKIRTPQEFLEKFEQFR